MPDLLPLTKAGRYLFYQTLHKPG